MRQTKPKLSYKSPASTHANKVIGKTTLKMCKKCPICQKLITSDKYVEHFETCYRYQPQKHQVKRKNPVLPVKQNVVYQNLKEKQITKKQHEKQSNIFRIKNTSKYQSKTELNKKKETKQNFMQKDSKTQNIILQNDQLQKKQCIQTFNKNQGKRQQIIERQSTPPIFIVNPIFHSNDPNFSQILYSQDGEPVILNQNNQPLYVINPDNQNNFELTRTNNTFENIGRNNNNRNMHQNINSPFIRRQPPNNRHNDPILSFQEQGNRLIPQVLMQDNIERQSNDINNLICNTNQIITFIQGMEGVDDEVLEIMVAQLRQLNVIANQIRDLDMIGNNLGFRMGQVFTNRIRQLQTNIINQIGVTLIRRFSQRIGPIQLQTLLLRQPQLRPGFSSLDIQRIFPNKINIRDSQCSICIDDIKRGTYIKQLQCRHIFHPDCIKNWLEASKKCPMCRQDQVNI